MEEEMLVNDKQQTGREKRGRLVSAISLGLMQHKLLHRNRDNEEEEYTGDIKVTGETHLESTSFRQFNAIRGKTKGNSTPELFRCRFYCISSF